MCDPLVGQAGAGAVGVVDMQIWLGGDARAGQGGVAVVSVKVQVQDRCRRAWGVQ